jgi:hypothetical protein
MLSILGSVRIASATTVCLSNEWWTLGSIVSGSSANLCAIDGSTYVLREALNGSSVSHLNVKWDFVNVPAGTVSLHFHGIRPANSDGDNFQFYYNTNGAGFGTLIPGALINKSFAPVDGVTITLETTTSVKTFTVFLADTAGGSNLDTVTLDAVRIISQ